MNKKRGFTLVELLIVISILGIIAAIIAPMYSDAGEKARTSALTNDLQKVRTQIEIYKCNHKDFLPAFSGESSTDFERRMTSKTDKKSL